MKIILTQDVKGLGAPGDQVTVKDGYGRNFLIPQGVAILATAGAAKQVATIRRARDARAIHDVGQAQDLASSLQSMRVTLPTRAGQGGRLFGSVTAADVVAAVAKAGGPKLDKRRVAIAAPIKTLGTHTVSVRLHADVEASIALEVVAAS